MSNFLNAGELIVQRLKDKVSLPENKIRLAQSDEWVIKNTLPDNSISVIFFDDQPNTVKNSSIANGKKQFSTQFWMIVMSTRNVADCGIEGRKTIGVIFDEVLKACQGFRLSQQHGELHRESSPFRPTDGGNGFVHISVLFSTVMNTVGLG